MTDKEILLRQSLNALYLELPASIAANIEKVALDALEEARAVPSNSLYSFTVSVPADENDGCIYCANCGRIKSQD